MSMSGAVIVPDLSTNQVAIKALQQFTAVNGFINSVIQRDGRSGLLGLQELFGREGFQRRSVHRTHAKVKAQYSDFTKPYVVKSDPTGKDLLIILDFIQIKYKVHCYLKSLSMRCVRTTATL